MAPRMLQSIRQELVWVAYSITSSQSFMARAGVYAFNQACATRGFVSLQWILLTCEAARMACVEAKNWDEVDRAEALYKRAKRIETRTVNRHRGRRTAVELPLRHFV